ncbi:transmembrane protease serine 7 [Fundulus heteroclitus]|uniref:transmembrane protease serine 7 n=1 Tax=Fundulus heteroclitus TaxID=8078 RepID=UPI00165AD90A|nr:transmembrane protease serine 7 [Fundulus heteroclitus]
MGTTQEEQTKENDGDGPQRDTASIADVSVEVATVDHTLQKLRRMYRRTRRKPKGLKRLVTYLLNVPHITVIITAVVFVVVVIIWSLLWVFVFRRESYSGAYFAGMLRVANMEFIPEYRQAESHEFLSMATKVQDVVGVGGVNGWC